MLYEVITEMLLGHCRLRFLAPTWFAVTGCDCGARLDGTPVWPGWSYQAAAGQELLLGMPRSGLCAYLALAGGIQVPSVMGARATDLQGGFGGLAGRALQVGDCLSLGQPVRQPTGSRGILLPRFRPVLRLLPGPES